MFCSTAPERSGGHSSKLLHYLEMCDGMRNNGQRKEAFKKGWPLAAELSLPHPQMSECTDRKVVVECMLTTRCGGLGSRDRLGPEKASRCACWWPPF